MKAVCLSTQGMTKCITDAIKGTLQSRAAPVGKRKTIGGGGGMIGVLDIVTDFRGDETRLSIGCSGAFLMVLELQRLAGWVMKEIGQFLFPKIHGD